MRAATFAPATEIEIQRARAYIARMRRSYHMESLCYRIARMLRRAGVRTGV